MSPPKLHRRKLRLDYNGLIPPKARAFVVITPEFPFHAVLHGGRMSNWTIEKGIGHFTCHRFQVGRVEHLAFALPLLHSEFHVKLSASRPPYAYTLELENLDTNPAEFKSVLYGVSVIPEE